MALFTLIQIRRDVSDSPLLDNLLIIESLLPDAQAAQEQPLSATLLLSKLTTYVSHYD